MHHKTFYDGNLFLEEVCLEVRHLNPSQTFSGKARSLTLHLSHIGFFELDDGEIEN